MTDCILSFIPRSVPGYRRGLRKSEEGLEPNRMSFTDGTFLKTFRQKSGGRAYSPQSPLSLRCLLWMIARYCELDRSGKKVRGGCEIGLKQHINISSICHH